MLIGHSSLLLFVAGAGILLVIPGPAVTYVVSRSVAHGRTAGLVSALGIVVGTLCHVLGATLGLSALLVSSAQAFQLVKYVGAAYLVYLGIRTLSQQESDWIERDGKEIRLIRILRRRRTGECAESKDCSFFSGFLTAICRSKTRPRHTANPGIGHFVRAYGLVRRFGLCLDCGNIGRATP